MNLRLLFFVIATILFGCSTTHYGQQAPIKSVHDLPSIIRMGQKLDDVFQAWGPPDKMYGNDNRQLWSYRVVEGNYFLFLGTVSYRDLVVTFEDDTVTDIYYLEKGKSMGMFAPPGHSK